MFIVTPELKIKIKQDMKIFQRSTYPEDALRGEIKFGKKEKHLFYECCRWWKHIDTYFKTSYTKKLVKINAGMFKGVFPYSIGQEKIVVFSVDCVKPSWRDWFVIEG